ncbi:MAG: ClpXP protease specificity-enhancing factor [Gammaproteobacteria bacterium]|nr:MAG: ClpXP protease specificity-enhancing factor [Gammaproteobacteria bacterium]
MSSSRPYLLRALYEWIVDNGCTPHLVVAADLEGVAVPRAYVRNGQIVLNVSPEAVRGLEMGNEEIRFGARFAGRAMEVRFPPRAVLAIYARETGKGMVFSLEDDEGPAPEGPPTGPSGGGPSGGKGPGEQGPPRPGGRPRLRVVR